MRRLMLLRHAKTESDAASGEDIDRRLDSRGLDDAAMIGRWIARHAAGADLALVSPAVRARQTWEIIAPLLAPSPPPAVNLAELYGASAGELLGIIGAMSDRAPRCLLLVGHNPGFHELALALTAPRRSASLSAMAGNFPTSGLAVIDFAIEDWRDVSPRQGHLAAFVTPRILRDNPDSA